MSKRDSIMECRVESLHLDDDASASHLFKASLSTDILNHGGPSAASETRRFANDRTSHQSYPQDARYDNVMFGSKPKGTMLFYECLITNSVHINALAVPVIHSYFEIGASLRPKNLDKPYKCEIGSLNEVPIKYETSFRSMNPPTVCALNNDIM